MRKPKRWDMPPRSAAALTLMQFCRCCLTQEGAQRKRSCRFGNWKRESPRMVRPATCRGRHSCGGFYAHAEVGRDHDIAADRAKGPPLGAFYLAPYQGRTKGIPSATTTTVKVSKSSMSISPRSPETSSTDEHYDLAALSDGV